MDRARMDGGSSDALVRSRRFFTKGTVSEDLRTLHREGRPRRRRLLPGPVEPRQGGALHPRGELHRLVLVEGLRQGRDHHLGDPADRLPVGRAGPAGVRAPRLPARCGLLLVHLLARPGSATPTSAACCCRCTARPRPSTTATRSRPGRTSSTTRSAPGATSPPAARAAWSAPRWDEATEMVAAAYVHTIKKWGPDRVAGLLADPRDVDGLPRLGRAVHLAGRRLDAVVLRLVRRPAGRLAAGLRRPDRRARVRRLVGRRLPDHVGLQRAGDPHPRRALDDRGPLPRPEGRRGRPRLRRQREVRRRVAGGRARHRRRRWRWRWATSSSRSSSSTGRRRTSPTT